MRKWAGLWLSVVLSVSGVAGTTAPAAAEGNCDGRVFAVEADAGHLVEIPSCPESAGFGAAVEVDAGDWRGYQTIVAVRDGAAAIIYAVTGSGELWWRRQESAGSAAGAALRVGPLVDWAQPVMFISGPGYLEVGGWARPVQTFRHQEWRTGGAAVSAAPDLFAGLIGPTITAWSADCGYAVGVVDGLNFRVWGMYSRPLGRVTDVWFLSGRLPAGVPSAVGDGHWLYAVNPAGEIILLAQMPSLEPCQRQDTRAWQVRATAPGHYLRVVVPALGTDTGVPSVAKVPNWCPTCPSGSEGNPWEWQDPPP